MRGMLDSIGNVRRDGEWLFTFGVVYDHFIEEVDVYADQVAQARRLATTHAKHQLIAGWSEIVLMEPGGTGGLAQF